jgi:hypothetical protein
VPSAYEEMRENKKKGKKKRNLTQNETQDFKNTNFFLSEPKFHCKPTCDLNKETNTIT